jgi:hypothetical protein
MPSQANHLFATCGWTLAVTGVGCAMHARERWLGFELADLSGNP